MFSYPFGPFSLALVVLLTLLRSKALYVLLFFKSLECASRTFVFFFVAAVILFFVKSLECAPCTFVFFVVAAVILFFGIAISCFKSFITINESNYITLQQQ